MQITIEENPIPKLRARFCRIGGNVKTYDSQSKQVANTKNKMIQILNNICNHDNKKLLLEVYKLKDDVALNINILFYLPIPKSFTIRDQNLCLWGVKSVISKPDIDNLAKYYLDCMNGLLFQDDKQIISLKCLKKYSNKPRVVIDIDISEKHVGYRLSAMAILKSTNPKKIVELIISFSKFYGNIYSVEQCEDSIVENSSDICIALAEFLEESFDTLNTIKKSIDKELKNV